MKLLTALVCTAALALSATAASAAVVCNDEGDCWRVKERRDYKPELKLRVYDDDWITVHHDDMNWKVRSAMWLIVRKGSSGLLSQARFYKAEAEKYRGWKGVAGTVTLECG